MKTRRLGRYVLVPEDLAPKKLIAIDPPDCGCTECLTGEYRPLDQATDSDLERMRLGELRNNTGYVFVDDPNGTYEKAVSEWE